ncbi:Rap1a/Tai family immunity protein [Arenicellales bacterium IMCC56312]
MKTLLPIILLLSLVAPAKAEINCGFLAEGYLEYARPASDATSRTKVSWYKGSFFLGFVSGYFQRDAKDIDSSFNIPKAVTIGQVSHVVGKYIQAHPEMWHLSMSDCLFFALYETWPKS